MELAIEPVEKVGNMQRYEVSLTLPRYKCEECDVDLGVRAFRIYLKEYPDVMGVSPDDSVLNLPTQHRRATVVADPGRIESIVASPSNEHVDSMYLGTVAGLNIEDNSRKYVTAEHPGMDVDTVWGAIRMLWKVLQWQNMEERAAAWGNRVLKASHDAHMKSMETRALDFVLKGAQVCAFNHALAAYDRYEPDADTILIRYEEHGPQGTTTDVLTRGWMSGGFILATGAIQGRLESERVKDYSLNIQARVDYYRMGQ